MRRKAPVIVPKGHRYPGSGRVKGTPNRVSVEVKTLVSELVTSPSYQSKLRRDFEKRKVHPTIENMVWAYHLGKPRQDIQLDATVTVDNRIEAERAAFATLPLHEMEELAAESQRLVDRALALSRLRIGPGQPQDVVVEALPAKGNGELLEKSDGSDNGCSDKYPQSDGLDDASAEDGTS